MVILIFEIGLLGAIKGRQAKTNKIRFGTKKKFPKLCSPI